MRLIPVSRVYEEIDKRFDLSMRIVRWYVTEGLLPPPERQGRESFYDLEKTQLFARLELIKHLQASFGYSLDQIKSILALYGSRDMEVLLTLLEQLSKGYPPRTEIHGHKVLNIVNAVIHNELLDKLEGGQLDAENFSLTNLAAEIKNWTMDDFGMYQAENEKFTSRFKE